MRAPTALSALRRPGPGLGPLSRRAFGTTAARRNNNGAAAVNPRWLSELQARIGRCAALDLGPEQRRELEAVRETVDGAWLELVAGREGFLTGPGWRGLDRHTVTWGDQDAMYAESARVNWLRNFATAVDPAHADEWNELMTPRGIGLIMRSIRTDYKFPMAYPDNVTVLHKLASKPTYESDHILLEALLVSDRHRRPAARCFEDIVVYDYKTARRAPLKPFMVDRLRETYEAQERGREDCEERVRGLVGVVERIERAA
ncbi:hypothetical protein CkaCkLH20_11818 [Colletotrichum karsti]|uniref:Uncharacterized protein n=1 Tax=Colletotrichum karsti TaxID=1095194 RepID=A0A9P6HX97_9PEZI|nr:uncharacterized protein CkaCkLH20_11818 [Colletotrichum karsti]KAF9870716.1 hypothetical protein CkaCkLH20_11818 [Colletotrichum karsti]